MYEQFNEEDYNEGVPKKIWLEEYYFKYSDISNQKKISNFLELNR